MFKVVFAIFLGLLFTLHAEDVPGLRVVIIGDSGTEKYGEPGYSPEVLANLLRRIKQDKPDAVFFTLNLIGGLEQSTSPASLRAFQRNLNDFSQIVFEYLGNEIPIYPVLGNRSLVNTQAVAIFRDHFKINSTAPLEPYQFAYVVMLDHVQFTVLATGDFERKFHSYRQYQETMPILSWLEKVLRTGVGDIRYRFVLDYEPAFSTSASAGIFTGMDRDPERRDRFWNILKSNQVLAYFSANEAIFDRSNRGGVWQVISGGAGPSLPKKGGSYIFYHYVILTVPNDLKKNPIIEVKDYNGTIWDKFELIPFDRPVYELRISRMQHEPHSLEKFI